MAQITHHTVRQYPVIVESDETGGYVAECPSFEGCFTQGETLDEALQNIKKVIEMCAEEMKAETSSVPARQIGIHLVNV